MDSEKQKDVFRVEKILQERKRKGCVEYLVKWQGYSRRHNSWEPEDNILDTALINQYHNMENSLDIHAMQPPSPKPSRRVSRRKSSRYSSCESLLANLTQVKDTQESPQTCNNRPQNQSPQNNVENEEEEDDVHEITPKSSPSPNSIKPESSGTEDSQTSSNSGANEMIKNDKMEVEDAPCLMPMVSESELWLIKERNKIQQDGNPQGGFVPIVVTDVKGPLFSVIFKEATDPQGFFSCV